MSSSPPSPPDAGSPSGRGGPADAPGPHQGSTEHPEPSVHDLLGTIDALRAANQGLQATVGALTGANADLQTLIASTDIATLFLDRDLRLKRFTPRAADLFHVHASDVQRPFGELSHRLRSDRFGDIAARVLATQQPVEIEAESEDGSWFTAHVLPCRTADGRVDGVVLTFTDITEPRRARDEATRRARQQAAVADLGVAALHGASIPDLSEQACRSVIAILGADVAKVLRHRPEHADLVLEAGVGWPDTIAVGRATVPDAVGSQAGFTLLAKAPVVVPDLAAETRFTGPPLLLENGIQSGVSVPIHGIDAAWGVLGVHSTHPRTFTNDDAQAVQALANVLADALRRADDERTIAQQLAEIETVYGTAPVGLAFMDPDLRYRRINQRLADINGLPVEAHIGKRGRELFPLLADTVEPLLKQVLETGEPVQEIEFRAATLRDPDDLRDWLCSYVPDLADDGTIRGVSVVVRDTTDRTRAQADRAAALAELDFVLDGAQVGVWSRDLATETLSLDERGQAIAGLTPDAAFADVLRRVHPDDREAIEEALGEAVASPSAPALAVGFRHQIGEAWRWIEVRGRFLPDRGAQGTLAGILFDATESREVSDRARQQLSEIEAYFRAVPLVVSVVDAEGRYLRVNAQIEALSGLPAEAIIGQHSEDLFPEVAARVGPLIKKVFATGIPLHGVPAQFATPLTPDDPRDWRLYVYPVVDKGEVIAVTVGSQDVTDLTRAQEGLRKLTAELEARVKERTRQVRGLAIELTRAEEAERQRIALVLHDDLQQTLFAVQVKAELLGRTLGDDAAPARAILAQADALLDLAILSARTLSVDLSPPVLNDEGIVQSLEWLAHRVEEAHGLEVAVEGRAVGALDADLRTLLVRAVRELLFNVAKHAGVGEALVRIASDVEGVQVEVIDHGVGFDPATAGTQGFGLDSIRRRLELVGGGLALESAPGAGTRAVLTTPLAFEDLPAG